MKNWQILIIIITNLGLAGCAQHDPWADHATGAAGSFSKGKDYEFYQPSVVQIARMRTQNVYKDAPTRDDPNEPFQVTDADVLTYADHVKGILRAKFTNARVARYVSSTTQVALIAAAGIAGVTNAGATTIAALALGTTIPPQLADIFHAKERADAYKGAAANIEIAEASYYTSAAADTRAQPVPSASKLTEEGAKLFKEVTVQIEAAEAVVAGQLPAIASPLASPSPAKSGG